MRRQTVLKPTVSGRRWPQRVRTELPSQWPHRRCRSGSGKLSTAFRDTVRDVVTVLNRRTNRECCPLQRSRPAGYRQWSLRTAVRAGGLGCQWSDRLCRVGGVAVFALSGEKLGPRNNLRVLLEQRPPLAFSHAAPDTELHPVVE